MQFQTYKCNLNHMNEQNKHAEKIKKTLFKTLFSVYIHKCVHIYKTYN